MIKEEWMLKEWQIVGADELGINLVSLKDGQTGITISTPIAKMGGREAAITAYTAARFSRSGDSVEEILREAHEKGVDPEQRLANFFRGYGHSSVADMAPVMIYVQNIPIHIAALHYYWTRDDAGQERSTRFQNFSKSKLPDFWMHVDPEVNRNDKKLLSLKTEYEALGEASVALYLRWTKRLTETYRNFYKPNTTKEEAALVARVFDSSRGFLTAGIDTSFADLCSAREWARLIGLGKGGRSRADRILAEQLEELLAPTDAPPEYVPEVASLIRHTESSETTGNNLAQMKKFFKKNFETGLLVDTDAKFGMKIDQSVQVLDPKITIGEKLGVQYLLSLYPNIAFDRGLTLIRSLDLESQKHLSELIFQNHSHLKIMGNQAEITGLSTVLTLTFAEARDLDRHRAQGKFSPWFEIRQNYRRLFDGGFILPLYLNEVDRFRTEKQEYVNDMKGMCEAIRTFSSGFVKYFGEDGDDSLLLNLFPLNGAVRLIMHGDPKQEVYIGSLRERPGGHINYRALAWERAKQISQIDPLLAGILLQSNRPNPASREEFFNRG